MWTVTEPDVGTAAWRRMTWDGTLKPVTPWVALPADIPEDASTRLAIVAPHLRRTWYLTGLAAIWVTCGGSTPDTLDLITDTRHHARCPSRPWPVAYHYSTRPSPQGEVAALPRAIVDALRWSPLHTAIPAVATAIRHDPTVSGVVASEFALLREHDSTRAKARRAWRMLSESSLVTGPGVTAPPASTAHWSHTRNDYGRRIPVTRRAS